MRILWVQVVLLQAWAGSSVEYPQKALFTYCVRVSICSQLICVIPEGEAKTAYGLLLFTVEYYFITPRSLTCAVLVAMKLQPNMLQLQNKSIGEFYVVQG